MPTRRATATWEGGLKDGNGQFRGESGSIEGGYTAARFEEGGGGTNPEELLAAAEASCFSMALAADLEREGASPRSITTDAACTVERVEEGFRITTMTLRVHADVPDVDEATFRRVAEATKEGCPVSKTMLGNVEIQLDAQLEQQPGSRAGG